MAYLPGAGDYYDQEDSAPRVRLAHCTSSGLTTATTSNRRGSGAKFLLVGLSVRADPVFQIEMAPNVLVIAGANEVCQYTLVLLSV